MTRRSVRLFARYAELLGAEVVEVELPHEPRARDVIDALRRLPGGALLPSAPFLCVAQEQVPLEQTLPPHGEIALLPPLAGG